MTFRFVNRVTALVTATVAVTDTHVTLETGAGALMPVLNAGEVFQAALVALTGVQEIVQITEVVGDVVTVTRGQEGTPAATFPSGSRLELRVTAAILQSFLQRTGGTMQGPLDMANNPIQRATFSGPVVFSTIHATAIRATDVAQDAVLTSAENAIVIPANTNANINARRPAYFGHPIVNTGMMLNVVMDWWGDVANLPPHFRLCDGTLGTPDLRGKFIRGWLPTFGVGGEGGAPIDGRLYTEAIGGHSHGGATAGAALSVDQLAPHQHTETSLGASGGGTSGGGNLGSITRLTGVTGSGNPHAHGIVVDGAHAHIVTVLPAFYVLARVMFSI